METLYVEHLEILYGPSMEKPSILKFAVLRKRALKLIHLPFPVFLNLGNDKHL